MVRKGWAVGAPARDIKGDECLPCHRRARSFSLDGALQRAYPQWAGDLAAAAAWNDAPGRTGEEVEAFLAWIDDGLAAASEYTR